MSLVAGCETAGSPVRGVDGVDAGLERLVSTALCQFSNNRLAVRSSSARPIPLERPSLMKIPSKKSTLALSVFLIGYGATHILHLNFATISAIVDIAAVAAGVLIWLDR